MLDLSPRVMVKRTLVKDRNDSINIKNFILNKISSLSSIIIHI